MEVDEPAIDAAALPPAATDTAAAADLLQISASANAVAGQLRADMRMMSIVVKAQSSLILCSVLLYIAACRCLLAQDGADSMQHSAWQSCL